MHSSRSVLLLGPVTLLFTACDSTAPHPFQRINLSATIGSAGAQLSGPVADVIVSGSGGTVRITSAQIVLSHIRLASDAACANDTEDDADDANEQPEANDQPDANEPDAENSDEHDCKVRVEPVLLNLPLDGTTKAILDALVPAGTYTGLRAKLEAVENDEDHSGQFLTDHPEFDGVSVKVVGVFTDAGGTDHPFTFTSHVEAQISVDFASAVTVDATTTNLTIDVDVGSWFKDASGAVIDPTSTENQTEIAKAIRTSFHAFQDDNHDGNDDHGEGGGS